VTALKRVEQSLREADRRKDEFLATLAHELRNPLAAITAALAVQRKTTAGAAPHSQEILERQTAHLVRLVDDLIDISRITRGKVDLRRQRVELNTLVRDAVASVPIPSTTCNLVVSAPPEPLVAFVDPDRIAQVITNLITNAWRYSKHEAHVAVSLSRSDDDAVIAVRDNGIGIPRELLARVFDMFVQLESSAPDRQWTLGIGLTLVRSLVELHGGRVEAKSDGPDTGSEFRVYLPLAGDHGSRDAVALETHGAEGAHVRTVRALVVDDNRDAADMMAALLESGGHQVRVAYDGAAALDAFGTGLDLALIDLAMPGMDGFELARRVRQNARLNHVCLVALTGFGDAHARERSTSAGFDYHLVKPVSDASLQELIIRCHRRLRDTVPVIDGRTNGAVRR
jgi:CheY-like chemotaxis protein